jgi:hypothetical protein
VPDADRRILPRDRPECRRISRLRSHRISRDVVLGTRFDGRWHDMVHVFVIFVANVLHLGDSGNDAAQPSCPRLTKCARNCIPTFRLRDAAERGVAERRVCRAPLSSVPGFNCNSRVPKREAVVSRRHAGSLHSTRRVSRVLLEHHTYPAAAEAKACPSGCLHRPNRKSSRKAVAGLADRDTNEPAESSAQHVACRRD